MPKKEDDILFQEKRFIEQLREDSENADRGNDRGIINEEKGSSILLKENGDSAIASSPIAQIKIDSDGNTISSVSLQSNTITNRKNIIADEITFNEHKLNGHITDLSDMRVLFGKKEISAGNLNMAGTMLVKVWNKEKDKWVLMRRQTRMPLFYNKTTLPDAPDSMSINTEIDMSHSAFDNVFDSNERDSSIENLRNDYQEKGFDKMPFEILSDYLKNKEEAEKIFEKTGEWDKDIAERNKAIREQFGIKEDNFSHKDMKAVMDDLHRDKGENAKKYYQASTSELEKLLENKIKAQEEFKESGKWDEDIAKENKKIREKYGLVDISEEELSKILNDRSYATVVTKSEYGHLSLDVVNRLINNKIEAGKVFDKTGKWDSKIAEMNQTIRRENGINRDMSLAELSNLKKEIEKRDR